MKLLGTVATNQAAALSVGVFEKPVKAYLAGTHGSTGSWQTIVDVTNGSGVIEGLYSSDFNHNSYRIAIDGVEVFAGQFGPSGGDKWFIGDGGLQPLVFENSCKIESHHPAAGHWGEYAVRVFK